MVGYVVGFDRFGSQTAVGDIAASGQAPPSVLLRTSTTITTSRTSSIRTPQPPRQAFASLVGPGHHSYSYTARASSLGEFVAPPATAEEMYSPEIFGRCAAARVVVHEG